LKKIAVVGLGYVGLPLAIEFAKTRKVIGFDINTVRINQLISNNDVTQECSVQQLLEAEHISYTSNISDISDAQIYIVTVPTPIDKANRPDLRLLISASQTIGNILKPGDIVIYESTVYPGATEEICVPVLEVESGLKFNVDFFCGYSPERINPGDKVNTLTKIKKITSGSNSKVAKEIDHLYSSIIDAGTLPAASIKVAEAAKVIENTQRDLNIALINEISIIFGRLGIDTSDVLEAAGSKWNFLPFKPGLVGGHCIGVDPYYLTHKAEQVGYNPQVILAGRRINDNMAPYLVKKVVQKMLLNNIDITKSTVGVLGLTFKENCPDTRNSKIFDVISELKNWGVKVKVYDPWADPKEIEDKHSIRLETINKDNQVDSLIVAVGHNEFRNLQPNELKEFCRNSSPVIADVKSLFNKKILEEFGFSVFRL
jgi:UDP-N-acetyl-D-glucosamine/UDP-N-acetyl-D-galactosamine dehydrogenase